MQKVLLVAVAILFALGVLTSYQKHILDYRVSAITEIEFGQASAIEHREYLLRSCQSGVWSGAGNSQIVSATATAWRFPSTTAWCPAGKKVVGGGATCSTPGGSIWLVHSLPIGDNGWSGTCDTTQKQNASIVVYATCL